MKCFLLIFFVAFFCAGCTFDMCTCVYEKSEAIGFNTLQFFRPLCTSHSGLASLLIKEKKDDLLQQQLATTIAHQEEQTLGGSSTDYGETTVCEKDPEQPSIEQKGQDQQQEPSTTRRKPSFFQSLHVLKDPQFMSLTLANVTVSIGYLVPLYYMQSMFLFLTIVFYFGH